jgi:hypothetical protein
MEAPDVVEATEEEAEAPQAAEGVPVPEAAAGEVGDEGVPVAERAAAPAPDVVAERTEAAD